MAEQTKPPAAQLLDELVSHAVNALTGEAHSIPDAIGLVPAKPGLYAVYADAATWQDVRLDDRRPESRLYVEKAERSLQARDIKTHFFTGRTGSSTVRRSFAAC